MTQSASHLALAPVIVELPEEVTRTESSPPAATGSQLGTDQVVKATTVTNAPANITQSPSIASAVNTPLTNANAQGVVEANTKLTNAANQTSISWSFEQWLQLFKEIVTSLLALMLVGYTLFMASRVFVYVGKTQEMSDAKDVLLLMFGLAGVVIGYYFGRIPADARATQAQQQVETVNQQLGQVNAKVDTAATQLDNTLNKVTTGAPSATRLNTGAVDETMVSDMRRVRDELRTIANLTRMR